MWIYVMMWKMSLREIFLWAMLKFLFFYMVEFSVVDFFFLTKLFIYLFMNIWWELRLLEIEWWNMKATGQI